MRKGDSLGRTTLVHFTLLSIVTLWRVKRVLYNSSVTISSSMSIIVTLGLVGRLHVINDGSGCDALQVSTLVAMGTGRHECSFLIRIILRLICGRVPTYLRNARNMSGNVSTLSHTKKGVLI